MAESLRQIKSRIRSIDNTKKLTRAMEMISVSKLKRTQAMLEQANRYSLKIESILKNIISTQSSFSHPLLEKRAYGGKTALFLITSDTGLCSVYNHEIIAVAQGFLNRFDKDSVKLVVLGRKGFTYFSRRGYDILNSYIGLNGRYSQEVCQELLQRLSSLFLERAVDSVYIAYTHVESAARHKPVLEKFLNIESVSAGYGVEYIAEPCLPDILDRLIKEYILVKIRTVILNAFTSEHQARAIAMGEATENAVELLERLVLLRNKIRQANITKEMLEIISSAEALKG